MDKKELTIPPKNRPEWGKLITGEMVCTIKNYVLQAQVYQLGREVARNQRTLESAIDKLYALCDKYKLVVQEDCLSIFKAW